MTQEHLQLIEPNASFEQEYEAYCREFEGAGEIPGNASMATSSSFTEGVQACLRHGRGEGLPAGWVPGHTFWLVRNQQRLIGVINVRCGSTPFIESEGGHIGYSVRPTEQGKGYATRMLQMAIARARPLGLTRVLITCDKRNVASARVIQKCDGVLENEVPSLVAGREITQRYWIELS